MTDDRVLVYERFFRAVSSDEEFERVCEIAYAADERRFASAGLMRSTYREGEQS